MQKVEDAPDVRDVLGDRQGRVCGEPAGTSTGEVDDVTGDMVGQVREQRPKRRPTDRPAVDEEDVGAGPDPPVGGFAGRDIKEPVGGTAKDIGGSPRGW